MKSSIKIDFLDKGKGLEPVIACKLIDSDDVRDKMLKSFFQTLGGNSSWLQVEYNHNKSVEDNSTDLFLTPVKSEDLTSLLENVKERCTLSFEIENPKTGFKLV